MCNATKAAATAILCAIMALAACSKADPAKEQAQALLDQVRECLDNKQFESALALLDSIDKAYPDQIEVRTAGLKMHPEAVEGFALAQLAANDSVLASTELQLNEVFPKLKLAKPDRELAGYYVAQASYNPNLLSTTGIQARVGEDDYQFSLVASVNGKTLGISRIEFVAPDGTHSTIALPPDSPRRLQEASSESAIFIAEECADAASWLIDNASSVSKAVIVGSKGSADVKLSATQAADIATLWRYSQLIQQYQAALINKTRLERTLQTARDQRANLADYGNDDQQP